MSVRTRRQIAEAIERADGGLVRADTRAWQAEKFPERVRTWSPVQQRQWAQFRAEVLRHGGYEVCPPMGPDRQLPGYLERGRTFDAYKARHTQWRGEVSRCHANVAWLYSGGEVQQIGTGFCLDGDGLWRQHSWGLLGDWTTGEPRKELQIAETTDSRLLYYGIVLTPEVADAWAAAQIM